MSKKKISGAARKIINSRRAAEVVKTMAPDTMIGRVTKLLGFNHIMVAIQAKAGPKEIRVRIPKLFTKKGATPITTREIVAIYVGLEFDPEEVKSTDQFDITAILTIKQANDLVISGDIPRWMVHEEVVSGNLKTDSSGGMGWEFGYSDEKDEKSDEEAKDTKDTKDTAGTKETAVKGPKRNVIVFGPSGGGDSDSDSDEGKAIDVEAI
jgi:hypothetical protein